MAFVGLAAPYIAKLDDEATKKYSNCFRCGKAMTLNITPNYNEAKLYADNQLSENVKEFKDGNISLGTDRLPSEAKSVCFGHEVDDTEGEVTYKTDDTANNVGVGFYVDQMINGKKTFVATIIYKVKFSESADDYTTKGDNIEFKTPTIEGTIAGLSDGVWKTTKEFATAADAEAYIQNVLGYVTVPPVVGP